MQPRLPREAIAAASTIRRDSLWVSPQIPISGRNFWGYVNTNNRLHSLAPISLINHLCRGAAPNFNSRDISPREALNGPSLRLMLKREIKNMADPTL